MKIMDARKVIELSRQAARRDTSNMVEIDLQSRVRYLADIAEKACDIQELAKWAEALYGGWVGLLENIGDDRCSQHNKVHLREGEHSKLLADLRGAHLKMQEAIARFDVQERGENS